jgi:chemotaxis protein CheD
MIAPSATDSGAAAQVSVGIGECHVLSGRKGVLVAYGLGSCVAVCAYDPVAGVGGILHAMLPTNGAAAGEKSSRYVNHGIAQLLDSMTRRGASTGRLVIKLVGGARVLSLPGAQDKFNVGARNIDSAREELARRGLPVTAADVGGNKGRTVQMNVETGQVMVRTVGSDMRAL